MAGISHGPIATSLVLLSDLPKLSSGKKVRFLGCVTRYSIASAILTLEHDHPLGNTSKALVDVELLLNCLRSNDTRIGEWVNVMGYISTEQGRKPNHPYGIGLNVFIQAIALWSSGPFTLREYEKSLDRQTSKLVDYSSASLQPS